MKGTSGLFLCRPFQHGADREDPAVLVELHVLPADEARTRGASARDAIATDPLGPLSNRITLDLFARSGQSSCCCGCATYPA